jgi:hypothetical protein
MYQNEIIYFFEVQINKMTKVKLRSKPITGNRHTLYLDFYPPVPHPETGKLTRRDFLGSYIIEKPKTPLDKIQNKEPLALAENIRSKRQLEIQAGSFDFLKKKTNDVNFIEYFNTLSKKQKNSNFDTWLSAGNFLKRFAGKQVQSSKLMKIFVTISGTFSLIQKVSGIVAFLKIPVILILPALEWL